MAKVAFIHVSDLHIGSSIRGGGIVPHAKGHDDQVLESLQITLPLLRQQYSASALVVTGDVTARGSSSQLRMYCTLRDLGFAKTAHTRLPPFRHPLGEFIEVPGNHDYWGGWIMNPTLNSTIRAQYFKFEAPVRLPTSQHLVSLHAICSTWGADPTEQFFAVGAFDAATGSPSAAIALKAELAASNAEASRRNLKPLNLVVTHHSPCHGNPALRGLADRSMTVLQTLKANGDIAGVLSGHAHGVRVNDAVAPWAAEVRCGTTTQATSQRNPSRRWKLLVHEFEDVADGSLQWDVTAWTFSVSSFSPQSTRRVRY